jgi:hypothetical protein
MASFFSKLFGRPTTRPVTRSMRLGVETLEQRDTPSYGYGGGYSGQGSASNNLVSTLAISSEVPGYNGQIDSSLETAILANSFGGGVDGAALANSLSGSGGRGNLMNTLALSSALGVGGGTTIPLTPASPDNSFGGGVSGALLANSLGGNGNFGGNENLVNTLAISDEFGNSGGTSSDLTVPSSSRRI